MLQFHTKLAEVFGQRSSFYSHVFVLMTTKVVTERATVLDQTVCTKLQMILPKDKLCFDEGHSSLPPAGRKEVY